MTYYDSFDCKINCEDLNAVSEEDFNDVMLEIALEREAMEGYDNWSNETERQAYLEQQAFERKQEHAKDWLGNYSPIVDGDTYEGISI